MNIINKKNQGLKQKIIFVAGLAHSGSTLLDLIIGRNPNIISLGEIYYTYNEYMKGNEKNSTIIRDNICSCSKNGYECSVWSEILNLWDEKKPKDYKTSYLIVIDVIKRLYHKDVIIIDSSKYTKAMKVFNDIDDVVDVYFIHIIKDVRAQLISWLRRRKQKGGKINFIIYFKLFRRWIKGHQRIEDFLKINNFKVKKVSYEMFCFNTDKVLTDLNEFYDYKTKNNSKNELKEGSSHVFYGNLFRLDSKEVKIKYDNDWFYKLEWMLPYFFMKYVRNYNKNIYKEISGK